MSTISQGRSGESPKKQNKIRRTLSRSQLDSFSKYFSSPTFLQLSIKVKKTTQKPFENPSILYSLSFSIHHHYSHIPTAKSPQKENPTETLSKRHHIYSLHPDPTVKFIQAPFVFHQTLHILVAAPLDLPPSHLVTQPLPDFSRP